MSENSEALSQRGFRRGFSSGARQVIEAVSDQLPPEYAQRLYVWLKTDVAEWRFFRREELPRPPKREDVA
jgi:hypothetical protein